MIRTLVKNHFQRSKPRVTNVNTKNILGYILLSILTVTILGIFGYILFLLTQSFQRLRLPHVYLKSVFLILLLVLTVYEIFNIIKQLYQSKDNHIYLKLPIEKEKVFLSKIIYLYLKQLIIAVLFLFVTAGIYGLVETDITFLYYLRLLMISFLLPLLSLIIASLLSIPVSLFMGVVRKRKVLLIISLIVVIGAFFLAYIQFINIVLQFIDITSASVSPVIGKETIESLEAAVNKLFISGVFYNLLMGSKFWINLIIITLVLIVLSIAAYYVLKLFYFKVLNKENERIDVEITGEIKQSKPEMAVFKKELKTLTRNPDYAFQAIVLNVLMPIFIYLTIKLTYKAGEASVGKEIVPGITLLTLLIFILLTNSFQGMIISREKEAHYITKIIPVKISRQIYSKIAFGYILNIVMLLVTSILITSLKFITVTEGVVVFILSVLFSSAYTFALVATDYKNPQLTSNEGGFDEGMNMYKNLFVGLFLAIIVGVIFSVTPYIRKKYEEPKTYRFKHFLKKLTFTYTGNTINLLFYGGIVLIVLIYLLVSSIMFRKAVRSE